MLRPQRHQPDPFDRRDLPRDESRETVGFVAPAESAACAQAATASATAVGIVYREGPGEVFTGALALPLALWGAVGPSGNATRLSLGERFGSRRCKSSVRDPPARAKCGERLCAHSPRRGGGLTRNDGPKDNPLHSRRYAARAIAEFALLLNRPQTWRTRDDARNGARASRQ